MFCYQPINYNHDFLDCGHGVDVVTCDLYYFQLISQWTETNNNKYLKYMINGYAFNSFIHKIHS